MKKRKTSSQLKSMAKEQLLGNYGVAAGAFAIFYGIILAVMILVYTAIFTTILAGTLRAGVSAAADESMILTSGFTSPLYYVAVYAITAVLSALMGTLFVGFSNVCLKIARGQRPRISDLFYCYSHHPDKVIIIYLIMYAVSLVLMIPAEITSYFTIDNGGYTGMSFLLWSVFYIVGLVLSVIFSMMVSQVCFLYLDDSQTPSIDFFKQSMELMKGNKGRLFYITLSLFGWYLLVLVSCGIAAFWVMPYQNVIFADFYRDLKGEFEEPQNRIEPEVDYRI
ncbi:MAG: DUF975 family protein [Lachnospiraceae bacterium]